MKSTSLLVGILLALAASRIACRNSNSDALTPPTIRSLPSPAQSQSSVPNLFTAEDGNVYLSWMEKRDEEQHALKFSVLMADDWSSTKTIAAGNNWFVNWADFPSLRVLDNGALVAHWLAKTGAQKYAYDVNISFSTDGGTSWCKPIVPHTDGTPTEHGFVSLLPWGKDRVLAVWLDGRDYWHNRRSDDEEEPEHGVTALRSAIIAMDGKLYDETVLDARVCDCCQTGAALTSEGAIVVYRDRSERENRDMSFVRFENGRWSQPQTLFNDGWEINGCPVNGPSVAAHDETVAVAWYTAAHDTAKVKIIFSHDRGKTFAPPLRVDDGDPMGRVSLALPSNREALVCWMEMVEAGAEVRVRRVPYTGEIGKSITVTPTAATRASGFPRMVVFGDDAVFAWTKLSDEGGIHTAKMNLRALP